MAEWLIIFIVAAKEVVFMNVQESITVQAECMPGLDDGNPLFRVIGVEIMVYGITTAFAVEVNKFLDEAVPEK